MTAPISVGPASAEADRREPFIPTSARGRRTRAKLIDAARQVFLDVGYGEASATLITGAAGVSYGSFYVYFASKSAIFTEVASDVLEAVYVASRAPSEQRDPIERLAIENARFFEVYREHVRIFQVVEEAIRADEEFRDEWRGIRRRNIARLARALKRLEAQGQVSLAMPAELLADTLGAMAERLAYLATVDDTVGIEQRIAALNAVWYRALGLTAT
jgi:AcrR family transcriptional regulator